MESMHSRTYCEGLSRLQVDRAAHAALRFRFGVQVCLGGKIHCAAALKDCLQPVSLPVYQDDCIAVAPGIPGSKQQSCRGGCAPASTTEAEIQKVSC